MVFYYLKVFFCIFNLILCFSIFASNDYGIEVDNHILNKKTYWYKQLLTLQNHGIIAKGEAEKILYNLNSPDEIRLVIEEYIKYLDRGFLDKEEFHRGWRIYDKPSQFSINEVDFDDFSFDNFESLIPAYSILKKKVEKLIRFTAIWSESIHYSLLLNIGDHHSDLKEINKWIWELGFTRQMLPNYFSKLHTSLFANIQNDINVVVNGQLTADVVIFLLRITREYIKKLKINMERIRWLPRQMPYPHVFVDIADYSVALVLAPNKEERYRAIVGSKEHQTPIFQDEITGVIVNPSWSVPRRLARNALLEAELREPGYLLRNGFEIYSGRGDSAENLDLSSIIWKNLKGEKFDFKIIQRPGSNNSLGLYKLHLSNPFDVYLHDTNKPNLYQYDYRAFSAGCVRVNEIVRLSQDLLNISGQNNINLKEIEELQATYRVSLNKPVPVFFAYFTAWPNSIGGVEFRSDVYNLDFSLYNAIE